MAQPGLRGLDVDACCHQGSRRERTQVVEPQAGQIRFSPGGRPHASAPVRVFERFATGSEEQECLPVRRRESRPSVQLVANTTTARPIGHARRRQAQNRVSVIDCFAP